MKKIFVIFTGSLFLFASCKKATQDLKPTSTAVISATAQAAATPEHGYYTVKLTVFDDKGHSQSVTQDISILCLFAGGVHPAVPVGG